MPTKLRVSQPGGGRVATDLAKYLVKIPESVCRTCHSRLRVLVTGGNNFGQVERLEHCLAMANRGCHMLRDAYQAKTTALAAGTVWM
jgi:hypothetical protein